jgi:hypothetical protein
MPKIKNQNKIEERRKLMLNYLLTIIVLGLAILATPLVIFLSFRDPIVLACLFGTITAVLAALIYIIWDS